MLEMPISRTLNVDVVHDTRSVRRSRVACVVGHDIRFLPDALESYRSKEWTPLAYDVMLVAAVVEFCDRSKPRGTIQWERAFHVRLPVHDVNRWTRNEVQTELRIALHILTGDAWSFEFVLTDCPHSAPLQSRFAFPMNSDTIVPYSDGLDSRAVAAVIERERPGDTIPVRVGTKKPKRSELANETGAFAYVPFTVTPLKPKHAESSGRSRGFKFAILSGLAAYLAGAKKIIVPESGQGTLGPILARAGQTHPDRRTHPQFTMKMARLFELLFERGIAFEHPVLWLTKGQSLRRYRSIKPDELIWQTTRSCWQDARTTTVDKVVRQCGICAACMLRRTSLHAAGYAEPEANYVCSDLAASDYAKANARKVTKRQRDYAIAGVLHMDHLADLACPDRGRAAINREASLLARVLDGSVDAYEGRILRLLEAHRDEWFAFVRSYGDQSFLRQWAVAV